MEDLEIIESLGGGGREKDKIAHYLFDQYKGYIPKVKEKLGMKQADIQDAYADAIIKLIRQLSDGSFEGKSKLSSYFYSIFYNTAVDALRKMSTNKIKEFPLQEFDQREKGLWDIIDSKEKASHVMMVMNQMGGSCKKILVDWAFYGFSMEEIAERSSLSNASSARSMKYKCIKKLRDLLSDKLFES